MELPSLCAGVTVAPEISPEVRAEVYHKTLRAREKDSVMEGKRRSSGRAATSSTGEASSVSLCEGPAKRTKTTPCIQYTDVTAASFRIRKGVKETPLKVKCTKAEIDFNIL